MKFNQFKGIAEVWHMEDFWHVHMAMKTPVDEDQDAYDHAELISRRNPKMPIRFTSAASSVVWFWHGEVINPFGPCSYTLEKGKSGTMRYEGFDVNSGLIEDKFRIDGGGYEVRWDPIKRFEQDKHSHLITPYADCKNISWLNATETAATPIRPGWELLAPTFYEQQRVRYHPYRQTIWIHNKVPRLGRLDTSKPTNIVDEHVFERGSILDSGQLEVVRVSFSRKYEWAREYHNNVYQKATTMRDHHRSDGPAVVTVFNVKDTIRDDLYATSIMGTYKHEWWRGGKHMTGTQVQDWAKRNGVIMIDHSCHDRPCFPNEMDRVAWALD